MQTLTRTRKVTRPQHRFLASKALYRGFVGGRGAGKSWVGAFDLLRRARRDRTYLIASPTGVLLHDTTFPTFKALAQEQGVWGPVTVDELPESTFTPTGQAEVKLTPYPTVRLTTGATVRFRTAEDPEKLRGPNLSGVWLDEASLMERDAYKVAIACLREKGEQGWLSATYTPKGFSNWTYDVFATGKPHTESFHSHTSENPFNPPGFADTLATQYVGLFADQELGGRYVNIEGAEWPPEYFTDDLWFSPSQWPQDLVVKAMALDPSKGKEKHAHKDGRLPDYSAFVWGGLDRRGCLWVDADLDNHRDATRIVEDGIGLYRRFQPAAFSVEVNQFQELLANDFLRRCRELSLAVPLYGITNFEPKETRIRQTGPYLARRELRFCDTPGCKKLVQQLRDFPASEYDDGPDALQMLLVTVLFMLGKPAAGAKPKPIRG